MRQFQPYTSRDRKSKYPKRPWSKSHIKRLKNYVDYGYPSFIIAEKFKRSRKDVEDKINELHLNDDYEPDPMESPVVARECLNCGRKFNSRGNRLCPACHELVEFQHGIDDGDSIVTSSHCRRVKE